MAPAKNPEKLDLSRLSDIKSSKIKLPAVAFIKKKSLGYHVFYILNRIIKIPWKTLKTDEYHGKFSPQGSLIVRLITSKNALKISIFKIRFKNTLKTAILFLFITLLALKNK